MFDVDVILIFFLIIMGFLAAFIDSVVGGGGLISLPSLLFIGLPPQMALGTNKLAGTLSSLTGTYSYIRQGKVETQLIKLLFPLSLIGAALGAYTVRLVPPVHLKPIILGSLLLVTIFTLLNKEMGSHTQYEGLSGKKFLFIGLVSFAIGFYDGFLGPGTGSFFLFAFLLLGFDFVCSAANARVLNFASNVAALIVFLYLGHVHFFYGFVMGISMMAGAWVGSRMAVTKGVGYVKGLFLLMTGCLILKQLWDFWPYK